ncbi:MAG: RNA polymerase sigma-70 factor [Bacteroidota bacterium]
MINYRFLENLADKDIIDLFKKDADQAIGIIFQKYYSFLCGVVYRVLNDESQVEDIVQEVFMELWKKHEGLVIETSLKAYLKRAAINKTLNFIRSKKMVFQNDKDLDPLPANEASITAHMAAEELDALIQKVIDELPQRCRIVFALSRFENMSYKEIALKLDISVKTVENQISKALKILRESLKDYL